MALLWLSIAFIAGILAGNLVDLSPWTAGIPCAVLILTATRVPPRVRLGPLLAAAALLGIARVDWPSVGTSPSTLQFYAGRLVQVDGVVDAEPDIRDTSILYVIRVHNLSIGGLSRQVSGRVEVRTARGQQFEYGDGIRLTGRLLIPRNTARLPWRDILAHQGIEAEMEFPAALDTGPAATGLLGWIVPLRLHLEQGIDYWLPEPEAALLIATALGAKSASLGDLAPALVATGLIHIIAISGIKVAMVAGTLYAFFRRLRVRLLTLVMTLLALAVYVVLTGATASGERSGLMWGMVFIAVYLGRGTVPLVSLGVVATCMVAIDPSLLGDIGFQLSTIGTFAIVALSPPLDRIFRYVPAPWREALSTTVAAQFGTVPIVVSGFHVVAFAGPLANALVLPVLPILIGLGFLLGTVSSITALAAPLGSLAYGVLHLVVTISVLLQTLGAVPVPGMAPVFSTVYYLCLGAGAIFLLRRSNWAPVGPMRARGREISFALLAGTGAALTGFGAPPPPADGLTWLGTGNAMLLTSAGRVALLDGGPKPFVLLERLGALLPASVHTIDLVVVTDPGSANITSLTEVLSHYRVLAVLDVGAEYPSLAYARWRAALVGRHIPVYALRTGAHVHLGHVSLVSLGPDSVYPNPHDSIGLLRIASPHQSVLLVGRASLREQVEAVFRPVDLRARVLVAGGAAAPQLIRACRATNLYGTVMGTDPVRVHRLGSRITRVLGSP